MADRITVQVTVNKDIDTVWACWTQPEHITKWNFASQDWSCPSASNDLQAGGKFSYRMEAKDGSMGFDFEGTYQQIKVNELISYQMTDGRSVSIDFLVEEDCVKVIESFEAEGTNSDELQRAGWQAILDNFKEYAEAR